MTLAGRRFVLALLGSVLAASCAHVEAPRGGPEDVTPPGILGIHPAPDTIAPGLTGPAVITFDERISEQGVEEGVILAPRTSPVSVSHGRSEIRVSLREGWAPGVIYQLTLLPEIRDLFGNRLEEATTIVFSTGPEIPTTLLAGRVTDRLTADPEIDVRVEAIRQPDSLVYATRTDSAGAFAFSRIPEGEYLVRAFEDLNRNRRLDDYERRDSLEASVLDEQFIEGLQLRLLALDTTPPVAGTARVEGRVFEVEFDDHLDPEQDVTTIQVTITGPDGAPVPVERVAIGALPAIAADTLLPPDTLPAPADTLRAAPDTLPAPIDPVAPGVPGPPAGPAEPMETAPGDQLPSRTLTIEVAEGATLEPEAEYRIDVGGVRNVVGLEGGGTVTVTIPEPPALEEAVVPGS